MKILSLRGENLASLAGSFSIDFTATPLAGAGLFAITGETGAGKSTLLDALCLALYAEYPRVDYQSAESTPDPSGEAIRANDPRHILRRGASSGYAEADFEGRDGHRYRARWELRRSKGNAIGNLQKEKRSLIRVADGQTLADKTREVLQQVEDLTGLNFQQFRRTSLLAQGQFDKFLVASANERAELLERITGSEIYALISKAIYGGAESRRQALLTMEAKRNEIHCLTPEERLAIEESLHSLQRAAEQARVELETTNRSLRLWQDHKTATTFLEAAAEQHSNALAAWEEHEQDRSLLRDLDQVEPLRPLAITAQQATRENEQASQALVEAGKERMAAEEQRRVAEAKLLEAGTAKQIIDQQVAAFVPQWQAAEALDVQVRNAAEQANLAAQTWLEAQRAEAEQTTSHQRLIEQRQQSAGQQIETTRWLEEHSAWAPAVTQQATVERLIAERSQLGAPTDAQALIGQLESELAALAPQLDAFPYPEQAQFAEDLSQTLEAARLCHTHTAGAAEAEATRLQLEASRAAVATTIHTLQIRLDEATLTSQRADQTASAAASSLRENLRPGEACPVCGSTEHPIHQNNPQLAALAADYRLRRDQLQAAWKQQNAEQTRLVQELATTQAQWDQHRQQLQAAQNQFHAFPQAHGKTQQDLDALREQLQSHRQGSERRNQMQQRLLAAKDGQRVYEQARNLHRQLDPLLTPLALRNNSLAEFRQCVQSYTEHAALAGAIAQGLQYLDTQLAGSESTLRAAHENTARTQQAAAQSQAELDQRVAQRRLQLDGQPVQPHREWHLEQQRRAAALHLEASTALASVHSRVEAAEAHQARSQQRLAMTEEAARLAKLDWTQACAAGSVETSQALRLLETKPQQRLALQEGLQRLDQQLHTARAKREEATATLAGIATQCAELPAEASLLEAQTATEAARSAALQQIGIEQQKLHQDNQHRTRYEAMLAEMERAREEAKIWQEVNHAIGSAGGDKFRKFVQALTLEHLVQLANYHLAAFSVRYRLARTSPEELTLQIVDHEMAGATRPVSTLSGGERFLISLGLALALSSLEGKDSFVDCLFIDEGFGSLDAESLDLVMVALETLPSSGRRVGVITHVPAMMDRIAVQIRVRKQGNGYSSIQIVDGSMDNTLLSAVGA
ncbi:AAA family ATPase [Bryobacter aggregatus]|uniref:AAA family ATPase n=1 Tax=Bryobacter aggregatus TaxID=360054 RepID=UPI0004E21791|nr:AAA family ATPase [Bryobacter aggregatus]